MSNSEVGFEQEFVIFKMLFYDILALFVLYYLMPYQS